MATKQNPHILVVDDEEDLCEILKFNLETEGYEVRRIRSRYSLQCGRSTYFESHRL